MQLTHTVGLLWTSDQPVAKASTYTGQHNIETQETNIHALTGIRTRDPSNQAAADLRLRPRGYRGRHIYIYIYSPIFPPFLVLSSIFHFFHREINVYGTIILKYNLYNSSRSSRLIRTNMRFICA
jgi:hypothetical protein